MSILKFRELHSEIEYLFFFDQFLFLEGFIPELSVIKLFEILKSL